MNLKNFHPPHHSPGRRPGCGRGWSLIGLSGILLVFWLLQATTASASNISWFSDSNRVNRDGFDNPMDGGFQFELGVFDATFVPTQSNIHQWLDHWNSAQVTSYVPSTSRFAGLFQVEHNNAPFTQGAPAWILGRRDTDGVREWILLRRNTWNWPAPEPTNPFPINWNVADANEVIIGSVNPGGSPHLMKAHVLMLTYSDWQAQQSFAPGEGAPLDDPDQDGQSNLAEFVSGSSPTAANPAHPGLVFQQDGQLFFSIPRRGDRSALITVEVSDDLITWHSGPAHLNIAQQTPVSLVVRDETFTPNSTRRFFRYHLSLE